MKKIGRYEVRGLLGKGGMGAVYKVRMPVTGKIVALKLLAPHPDLVELLGLESIRRRFVNEAIAMAGLRHPRIVDVWDFDEAAGRPFFVMEYYCNNLGQIMGETYRVEDPCRRLRIDKTIHYGRQVLEGLCRLHQAEIVHRDIKPFNILVTDEDTIKISDFGCSRVRGEALRGPPQLLVGSPYYAAPEQETDPDQVDVRADIYSLGVMLHRMLTGRLPSDRGALPSTFNADLNGAWDTFLRTALARRREQRFSSAAAMRHALDELSAAWQAQQELACRVDPEHPSGPERPGVARTTLRSSSLKVGPHEAQDVFALDALWRPRHYLAHDHTTSSDGTVSDQATGLIWQQAGSPYPMPWEQAHLYLQQLNCSAFAGRAQWRLPTVAELMSLITAQPQSGEACIEPVFNTAQRWLWSSDRRSFVAAWYVSVDMGFVAWQDFSCAYFVRAVCAEEAS
jgi:serine/threonine protein kinase